MSRRYPKELIQFVKDHGHEGTIEEMAERIRKEFGIVIEYPAMKSFFSNHKIHAAPRKGRKRPERPVRSSISEQEKIAKLYALAEKLHVKIGGDADGRP